MDQEISAIESEATIAQLREKAYNQIGMTGAKLQSAAAALTCPGCEPEVPAGKKFCGECGTKI